MNTSFPSAASDFGAFLAGGNQPNNNSQLKGILAGLGCAKPVLAGAASTVKTDFETMLDAPAAPATATAIAVVAGKPAGEVTENTAEPVSSVLTGELNAVVTTTLQIKGMIGGRCQLAPRGPETAPSEEGEVALSMTGEGETQPDAQTVDTDPLDPTLTVTGPVTIAPVPTEPAATDPTPPTKETTPGPTAPREIKLLPGRGHSVRGRGWNPAFVQHTGVCGKSAQPAKTEMPVVKVAALPATVSCSAPVMNPVTGLAPDMIVEAIAGIVTPMELPPVVSVTDEQPVDLSTELSTTADVDRPVAPLLSEPVVIVPAVTGFQIPDAPQADVLQVAVASDLTSVAPTRDVLVSAPQTDVALVPVESDLPNVVSTRDSVVSAPTDLTSILPKEIANEATVLPEETSPQVPINPVVRSEVAVAEVAVNDLFAPVLDRVEEVAEVAPDTAVPTETAPITPELRREVVETVAAMLAPFLTNLPVIPPELFPVRSAAQAGDAMEEGGRAMQSLTVTVKIGAQSRFSFELPQASLSETKTAGLLAATTAMDETDRQPAPAAFVLPATLSRLAEKMDPLDFRIQLKAKIDTVWSQADRPDAAVDTVAPMIPLAGDELKPDAPFLVRATVATTTPAISEELQTEPNVDLAIGTILQAPESREQAPKTEIRATPVEVMIKMPGFGVLTAQLMASDKTAGALLKKPGVGLGRTEKTAGDLKSDGLKDGQVNIGFEKTFLTPGTQVLKGKEGNAGTDVAISDDTMPARFTSRRVAVDPLEFPPRFNGREIQPIFNESQNFTATNETPVAATPAPVLAHRAVETILNVVEAQRQSSANASSVNLHFKFGGDDLAVRVQMRGGEVLTQFLTDSAELRSALSTEWQTMAGQGGAAGLRMQDPVIMPTSAGTSNGSGSMAQGQNQARQNAQQHQQEQTAMMMPELHALRHRAGVGAPKTEVTPRVSFTPSTSQHLTATA